MKKTAILFFAMMLTVSAFAQQKIAHISAQEILNDMPEFKVAQDSMDKRAAIIRNEIAGLEKELQDKKAYFDANQATMSDAMRQIKAQDFDQAAANYEVYVKESEKELLALQQSLLLPIEQKIKDAIDKVAKAKNVAYVLDASMFIYQQGFDLGPAVREELKLPPAKEKDSQ